jgi:hypothetical protein
VPLRTVNSGALAPAVLAAADVSPFARHGINLSHSASLRNGRTCSDITKYSVAEKFVFGWAAVSAAFSYQLQEGFAG